MTVELDFAVDAAERAGFTLVHFRQAATPVYVLTARVLTLDRKALNPIEEGCLRAIEAGLETSSDIRGFLGLQGVVLNSVLASLNSQELINYVGSTSGGAVASLTSKGRLAIQESHQVLPQERIVKLVFDPILRRVVFHQQNQLRRPKEARAEGRFEVPLCGVKRPEVEDIPLEDIDRALERLRRRNDESSELLALRRIERREMHFVPCTMLYYRSNAAKEIQVAFHFENGPSVEYENAFKELGGPEEVGAMHLLAAASEPTENPIESMEFADDETSRVSKGQSQAEKVGVSPDVLSAIPTLRVIRCHEHPPLLKAALRDSNERLLIISPWIRDQVVDKPFIKALETLLRSGVHVYIGYGLVEDGPNQRQGKPPINARAKEALDDLGKRYKNFTLTFIGNTHRKVLVSDTKFAVSTSFNWLSFKGDPKERPRDESGTLIAKAEYVEQIFQDNIDLIRKGYGHPGRDEGDGGPQRAQ